MSCFHHVDAAAGLVFNFNHSSFFSPDSSDELHAYLANCRPDLCILDGGEEEGEHEEEFVLIEDKDEGEDDDDDEPEVLQRQRCSGDDWEVSDSQTSQQDFDIRASDGD